MRVRNPEIRKQNDDPALEDSKTLAIEAYLNLTKVFKNLRDIGMEDLAQQAHNAYMLTHDLWWKISLTLDKG